MPRTPWPSIRRLWSRAIEPSPSVRHPSERRRAGAAAGLLLVLIPLGLLLAAFPGLRGDGVLAYLSDPSVLVAFGALTLLVVGYGLVRSRHYERGVILIVAVCNVVIWFFWAVSVASDPDGSVLAYLLVPLIISAFLLSLPATIALFFVNTVGLLVGDAIVQVWFGITPATAIGVDRLSFISLAGALVIVGGALLRQFSRDLDGQAEALRRADDLRLRLLNQVAHDLAAPLVPIELQLYLLEHGRDPTEEKRANSHAVIRRNLKQLERLVEDLKDLARLESGQLKFIPEPVELHELVQETAESLRPQAPEGLSFHVEVETPLPIHADRARIVQVLYNLVSNAFKFTPSGGEVRLSAHRLDHIVRLSVQDSGRGLTGDEIARLFQPFSQVHAPNEVKVRGTGLGLYISRGIIERHGGRIWAESKGHGSGSTFSFELPVRPAS